MAVSLREYLEQRLATERERGDNRFADHEQGHAFAKLAHEAEHAAIAKAIELADKIQDRANAAGNEWRATLTDNNAKYLTKAEADGMLSLTAASREALGNRITALERRADRAEGSIATWRFLAGFLGLGGIVSLALWLVTAFGPKAAGL